MKKNNKITDRNLVICTEASTCQIEGCIHKVEHEFSDQCAAGGGDYCVTTKKISRCIEVALLKKNETEIILDITCRNPKKMERNQLKRVVSKREAERICEIVFALMRT